MGYLWDVPLFAESGLHRSRLVFPVCYGVAGGAGNRLSRLCQGGWNVSRYAWTGRYASNIITAFMQRPLRPRRAVGISGFGVPLFQVYCPGGINDPAASGRGIR